MTVTVTVTIHSQAHSVACLGVSESDWETLGTEALNNIDLEVAKKAYMRIKNMPWLYLLDSMEVGQKLTWPISCQIPWLCVK